MDSVHGILQAKILEWVAIPFSRGIPDPRIKSRSPALQADSLPSEPPGKPKDYHRGHQKDNRSMARPSKAETKERNDIYFALSVL